MNFRTSCLIAVFAFLSSIPLQASAADKTDVVVMNNGDHFIGEIKQLGFRQLQFKASYMASSVDLDWTRVSQLESTRRFRAEFADGLLRTGSISKSSTDVGLTLQQQINQTQWARFHPDDIVWPDVLASFRYNEPITRNTVFTRFTLRRIPF